MVQFSSPHIESTNLQMSPSPTETLPAPYRNPVRNSIRGPVSGRGGRQGSGSHGRWSNKDRSCGPERYCKRSMMEDPWKCLKPIIWCSTYHFSNISFTAENLKPQAPSESTSTKREGPSAVFSKSNSGPSHAEYLASAFNEAANTKE
ncbi:unnamed protein product [Lathyrus sativus]|nr:unnamed protein product [Lathyrus sativus]